MIVGLGIDLVHIAKIQNNIQNASFLRKVFTSHEITACAVYRDPAEHYAGKFAAKEAFMKAIGKGIRQQIWFTQIEILHDKSGAPIINLFGEAEKQVRALEINQIHVSISHTEGIAVAVVILEGGREGTAQPNA